jgi:hypothetical protein
MFENWELRTTRGAVDIKALPVYNSCVSREAMK